MEKNNIPDGSVNNDQLKKYAADLAEIYKTEKQERQELQAANQQLMKYADDLNKTIAELQSAHQELRDAYTELENMHRAKERIINHLSHELKTPLSIIMSVLMLVSKKIEGAGLKGMDKTFARAHRNLNRLLDLQIKIDDIINQRSVKEKGAILGIIESAASIVGELADENHADTEKSGLIKSVGDYLENLFPHEETCIERVRLDKCLNSVCDSAISSLKGRSLTIIRKIEEGLVLDMDNKALQKMFSGLLKNAIENTPDGGRIEIAANASNDGTRVCFRDYGVGIIEQNRKNIFGGFFHNLDTNLYSSKNPYDFNAGGAGADLLRTKVFSERFGFSVGLESRRCKFIPTDGEICQGRISDCRFIDDESECLSSGGTTFYIQFPCGT